MSESRNWAFPARLQPRPQDLSFELAPRLEAVVLVHAEIPEQAFTASVLGTERIGQGTVIGPDGLVLTIGYLITEAESIWLTTHDGTVVPGHAVAYDHVTGFGLVAPLGPLNVPAMERGSTDSLSVGDQAIVIGHGGLDHALSVRIIARREFAGYWEYLLEQALFTTPAHHHWGGAALVGEDGRLLGVGSLLVQESLGTETLEANMFVPVDLLEPILADLIRFGRAVRTARPWLGMYTTPMQGQLVVGGLTQGGPAHRAGVRLGDVILEVHGEPVSDLPDLFRTIWDSGPAGTEIAMTVARGESTARVRVKSASRDDFLIQPRRH
jgi:S1-C subfamily serine protease